MKKANENSVEQGGWQAHKLSRRSKKLPPIEKIVKMRWEAGIAGYAERVLYLKGDLDDSGYDDAFKQQLLDELEQAKQK